MELDATVIELTDAGVKRLQQFGAKFIRVTSASGGDKSPEGEFSINRGAIQKIKDNEVYYYLEGALAATVPRFSYGTTKPSGCISKVGLDA